jgi:SAM-dependent methyltransferase
VKPFETVDTAQHAAREPSVEDRLGQFFTSLRLQRVHVASGLPQDAVTLARTFADRIASMALVSPGRLPAEPLRAFDTRLLFIAGDRGPTAPIVPTLLQELPHARAMRLHDHTDSAWADTVAERTTEVEAALREFFDDMTRQEQVPEVHLQPAAGEVAGITYKICGGGPPLLLLPLSLARSQWDPIVDKLAEHYTTIVLGGAFLGMVPSLEARMRGGYQTVVRNVVDAAGPMPGESILEVGCGSGAVARWLASYVNGANPLTAVDVNTYLLREATTLTRSRGLSEAITFEIGDAEALPIASESFDVTLSFTVMEEVDAERMLAELVRVTRRDGRIGVVVRAVDMLPWMNLDLPDDVLRAAERVSGAGADEHGCADASLYRRFAAAGLHDLVMGPQYAADTATRSPDRLRLFVGRVAGGLESDAAAQFRDGVKRATSGGTMVWAEPYHCAVGTKT